jgi:CheY-like chemotaxis protein
MNDSRPRRAPAGNPDLRSDPSATVAGVVHDVSQMLAVITGRTGLLLSGSDDPERTRHLRTIMLACEDASAMLSRLKSRPTGVGHSTGTVPLFGVAEQAQLLVWPPDRDTLAWHNRIPAELTTTAPAQLLREVLCNLILNAVAVLPDSGRVTLSAESGAPGRVILRVADDGPGLPAGDPEELFKSGVTGSDEPGRGIGLGSCRQLLATAEATISTGDTTAGAVFVLDLPAGPSRAAENTASVPASEVLVVEDETVVRDMMHDVLSEWGCRVQAYRDAGTALENYRPGTATVALIDENLPGLSGRELASRLRVGDPCLYIVLVSGWQTDAEHEAIDPEVVDRQASKPVAWPDLQAIVTQGHQLNLIRRAAAATE